MWSWVGMNTETVAAGIAGLAGILAAVWQWIIKARVDSAKGRADVAIAGSQSEVYQQMRERMSDMAVQLERCNNGLDLLREQLRERDRKVHMLELYVSDLQHILHSHGIDVPKMRA